MLGRLFRLRKARSGRIYAAALLFFVAVSCLVLIVAYLYLLPAFSIYHNAEPRDRKRIAAVTLLVLMVILFILFIAVAWGLRASEYFSRRKDSTNPKPTQYVDAWSESAKRLAIPPEDEEKEEDE